jgi:hypothetical protein
MEQVEIEFGDDSLCSCKLKSSVPFGEVGCAA